MLTIDGARYSGSGTIVRQAVAFAALTNQPIRIVNARARRDPPGLRPQHVRVVEAIGTVVNATIEGLAVGSREVMFRPGVRRIAPHYEWDIGTAGSTTMLALSLVPVLAFGSAPVHVLLRGGLFQDFAPSLFHVEHVMGPLLGRLGLRVDISMERPGYVPAGEGVVRLAIRPGQGPLLPVRLEQRGALGRVWGIALASHLEQRRVVERMAQAAAEVLARQGYEATIERREEATAKQPGAAFALFADFESGVRLGADGAGARGRPAEAIGRTVARQLIEEIACQATLDRFAADQVIPFAAMAEGESRFIVPALSDHIESHLWLARILLGAESDVVGKTLYIHGIGHRAH